jgi:hypothetical protein
MYGANTRVVSNIYSCSPPTQKKNVNGIQKLNLFYWKGDLIMCFAKPV